MLITEIVRKDGGHVIVRGKCDCGTERDFRLNTLRMGYTKSCGCLRVNLLTKKMTTHGRCKDRANAIWRGIYQRCYNPKNKNYTRYGGRGIRMDRRWHDYSKFIEDMGDPEDGMTIEREDNDKDYCKKNCKWASRKDQAWNRCTNLSVCISGLTKSTKEWIALLGIPYRKFYYAITRSPDKTHPNLRVSYSPSGSMYLQQIEEDHIP